MRAEQVNPHHWLTSGCGGGWRSKKRAARRRGSRTYYSAAHTNERKASLGNSRSGTGAAVIGVAE